MFSRAMEEHRTLDVVEFRKMRRLSQLEYGNQAETNLGEELTEQILLPCFISEKERRCGQCRWPT